MEIFDKNGNPLSIAQALGTDVRVELPEVTRVEVIDNKGRSYVTWEPENKTFFMLQDEGRTLKVFVLSQPTA